MALALTFMLLFTSASQVSAFGNDEDVLNKSAKAFSTLVKKAKPAVVYVEVEKTVGAKNYYDYEFFNNPFFERFFGPDFHKQIPQRQQKQKQRGQGSGFLISNDGYILTNNHVVEDADTITVTLADKTKVQAKLIGNDPQSDVALIKIDNGDENPSLPLGNSDALEVGEWVIAIGNPFGLTQTVTVGVVSAKGRSGVGLNEYENFIQTDAAINPGNSGGPLLNIQGEVIGINSALFSRTGGYMGIGFAIPVNMVQAIKNQLQEHGKVVRGWLGVGIQDIDEDLAKSFGLDKAEGILVSEVQGDSPADKAGLKRGDVITKVNNIVMEDVNQLRNKIALIVPKTVATFEIIRDGKIKTIKIEIGEKPSDFGKPGGRIGEENYLEEFGLSFQELTPELSDKLSYEGEQGVLIADVKEDGVAASAGLRPGMLIQEVNKKPVQNLEDLQQVLAESSESKRMLLRVKTGRYSQYVVLVAP